MHRQTNHLFCNPCRHRQILRRCRRQRRVAVECADERVEIPASQYVVLLHPGIQFVPRLPICFCVHEDGEVGVVVPDARHVLEESYALDFAESFAVAVRDHVACFYGSIDLPEVKQSVCASDLVHLAVDAGADDRGLVLKSEVAKVIYLLLHLLRPADYCPAFEGVVDLCGVETERGDVTGREYTPAVLLHSESMRSIVDDLESVPVRNRLDLVDSARLAVAVHGHDGDRFGRNCRFDLLWVEVAGLRVNVREHRLESVPPDAMGGGNEAVRRGDHFTPADVKGLKGCYQRDRAVGEKTYIWNLQIVCQRAFKPLMILAEVGHPMPGPDVLHHSVEFVKVREQGRGDCNLFFCHILETYTHRLKSTEFGILLLMANLYRIFTMVLPLKLPICTMCK